MASTSKSDAVFEERKGDSSSRNSSGVNVPAANTAGGDLDAAYWYVHESGIQKDEEATPKQLAALRRKIDFRIVPIMFLCYTMQFIDKVSLNVSWSNARKQSCGLTTAYSMQQSWDSIRN